MMRGDTTIVLWPWPLNWGKPKLLHANMTDRVSIPASPLHGMEIADKLLCNALTNEKATAR
jgi:hypothetical protein